MPVSKARRRANNRWDAQNMTVFSVKMTNRDAETLRAACAAAGVTPHSVFLAAARDFISTHPAPESGGGSGPADAGGLSASAPSDAPTSGGASDTSSGTDAAGHGSGADSVGGPPSGDVPGAVLDAPPDSVGAGHDPASGSGTSGAAAV